MISSSNPLASMFAARAPRPFGSGKGRSGPRDSVRRALLGLYSRKATPSRRSLPALRCPQPPGPAHLNLCSESTGVSVLSCFCSSPMRAWSSIRSCPGTSIPHRRRSAPGASAEAGDLLAAKRDLALPRQPHFLLLDDLGYLPQGAEESEVLFTLIAEPYERRSWASPPT